MSAKAHTPLMPGHGRIDVPSRLSRRDFLLLSGGTALALGIASGLPPWLGRAGAVTPRLISGGSLPLPGQSGLFGMLSPTGPFTLAAMPQAGLLPATGGSLLAYTTEHQGRVYHNPVLVLDKGQDFAVRMVNDLGSLGPIARGHGAHASHGDTAGATPPGPGTIIHWHGVDCPWQQAGHPLYAVGPGGHYDYAFPITNRAGTYWYHPHPHGDTARQAYLGLASFFIVRDDEERAFARELDLTLGTTDIPLVLQDKRIGQDGELVYAPTQDELFMGYLGDRILANGAHLPTLSASTRLYRFRLLNGSTARIFNLAFTGGSGAGKAGARVPMTVIANDGGFLSAPRRVEGLFLAPGERAEVLLDLRAMEPGEQVWLRNLPFDPMHNEMEHGADGAGHGAAGDAHAGAAATPGAMGGMEMRHDGSMHHGMNRATMPAVTGDPAGKSGQGEHPGHGGGPTASGAHGESAGLPEGGDYPILRVSVDRAERYDRKVPERLPAPDEPVPAPGGQTAFTRALRLEADGKRWTIAGETFAMDRFPITVPDRRREAWAMENAVRSMPHPMHLHGYFLQVRERRGSPAQVRALAVDGTGRLPTDLGLKDTVLVWPGETVLADVDFGGPAYPGEQIFLFHCHNLEHEDQGMMVNVRVS